MMFRLQSKRPKRARRQEVKWRDENSRQKAPIGDIGDKGLFEVLPVACGLAFLLLEMLGGLTITLFIISVLYYFGCINAIM
jgi:hypothetical protein